MCPCTACVVQQLRSDLPTALAYLFSPLLRCASHCALSCLCAPPADVGRSRTPSLCAHAARHAGPDLSAGGARRAPGAESKREREREREKEERERRRMLSFFLIHTPTPLPPQVCLEGEISRAAVISSLARGRRAAGDLIPWTISQQFQVRETRMETGGGGRGEDKENARAGRERARAKVVCVLRRSPRPARRITTLRRSPGRVWCALQPIPLTRRCAVPPHPPLRVFRAT